MTTEQTIKPIETRYRGYRFRSRLEARWAVFFDAMKAQWEYEAEGYDLGDGLRYLPDFVVCGQFIEVKPRSYMALVEANDPVFQQDWKRWTRLVAQTGRTLFVCHGGPGEWLGDTRRPFAGFCLDSDVLEGTCGKAFGFGFGECRRCAGLAVFGTSDDYPHYYLIGCSESCTSERHPIRGDALDAAIAAARSARFEHGEHGLTTAGSAHG